MFPVSLFEHGVEELASEPPSLLVWLDSDECEVPVGVAGVIRCERLEARPDSRCCPREEESHLCRREAGA
jgi:hypothetical protein